MINNPKDPQTIDAYLSGKMDASDKSAFENGLAQDPLMKQELDLQKDILESLKVRRKFELMARLDNIDVSGLTTSAANTTAWKIAASIFIGTGMLTAGYLFFKEKPQEKITKTYISQKSTPVTTAETNQNSIPNAPATVEVGTETSTEIVQQVRPSKQPVKKSAPVVETHTDNVDPNPLPIADTDFHPDANVSMPNGNIAQENLNLSSEIDVAVESKSENKFHYKYFNNKLYLYCDFNSKPYDLLELNTKKTKELYLYFDKQYYELKSDQLGATPLIPLKNAVIINQLELIRKNK